MPVKCSLCRIYLVALSLLAIESNKLLVLKSYQLSPLVSSEECP